MTATGWLDVGENRKEWARLMRGIELVDFFQLWAVHTVNDSLEAEFEATFGDSPVVTTSHWVRSDVRQLVGLGSFLTPDRIGLTGSDGWLITARGAAPEQIVRLTATLNQKRDVIREMLRGPLVLALHPLDWMMTRHEATDLWSVHVDVIRFTARPLNYAPTLATYEPLGLMEASRVARAEAGGRTAFEELRSDYTGRVTPSLDDLEGVVQVALASGLSGPVARRLLLQGLPMGFVYSLPTVSRPIDQLRFDLAELQRTPRLIGVEDPPLAVWLRNAARLTRHRPESAIFERLVEYLVGLFEDRPVPVVAPSPALFVLPPRILSALQALPGTPSSAIEPLARALADETSPGIRACLACDLAVATAAAGTLPSRIRSVLQKARSASGVLGDLRLLVRFHARAGWIRGHLGDRRSGLAEIDEGRRIVGLLGERAEADLTLELDTVAHWLETAPHETTP